MAGLGFKDFQVGEVLTSSDVDGYLMQQSVMRFADSAARGSALGTATGTGVPLAEGMVVYLDDVDRLEMFDGTEWRRATVPLGTAAPVNGSMLQYGTATAEYAPTAGPMFSAVETGQIPTTTVAASSGATVTVTFTAGRFSSTPTVMSNQNTTASANCYTTVRVISSSGFTMHLINPDGNIRDFDSQWLAVLL